MISILGGLLLGCGILLVVVAFRPPALIRIVRRHGPLTDDDSVGFSDVLAGRLRGRPADLEILGVSDKDHVNRRVVFIAVGCLGPVAVLALAPLVDVETTGATWVVLAVSSMALGFVWPDRNLTVRARAARATYRSSLSAYLDLVAIQLAGGAGMDTAFVAAGRLGEGPAFVSIATALDQRRVTREPLWTVFADLGERFQITELSDLASSVKLGGEHGARLTASLVARARAMRHRQMSDVEATANASTERMGLPMVAIFIGFLVLLGYPALDLINNGFA